MAFFQNKYSTVDFWRENSNIDQKCRIFPLKRKLCENAVTSLMTSLMACPKILLVKKIKRNAKLLRSSKKQQRQAVF